MRRRRIGGGRDRGVGDVRTGAGETTTTTISHRIAPGWWSGLRLRSPLTLNARVCSAGINDTLELGGSHPLASDVEMARLLDACNAARSLPVRSSAGGSASNVLRAVASFGASARLVGARGDDADGGY